MKPTRIREAQHERNSDLRAMKRSRGLARCIYPRTYPMQPGSVRSHDAVYFTALREQLATIRAQLWEGPLYAPSRQVRRRGVTMWKVRGGRGLPAAASARAVRRNETFDRVSRG